MENIVSLPEKYDRKKEPLRKYIERIQRGDVPFEITPEEGRKPRTVQRRLQRILQLIEMEWNDNGLKFRRPRTRIVDMNNKVTILVYHPRPLVKKDTITLTIERE